MTWRFRIDGVIQEPAPNHCQQVRSWRRASVPATPGLRAGAEARHNRFTPTVASLLISLALATLHCSSQNAGSADAGVADAGPIDAGIVNAGVPDAGAPDAGSPDSGIPTGAVYQHHADMQRTGMFIDPAFTVVSAPNLHIDKTFNALVPGPIYAQPLYAPQAVNGHDAIIVATEQNEIMALDAASGAVLWHTSLGTPVPLKSLPCGDIDPVGVTGTPVIDPASGTIFADAMTTPDGGATKKHLIYALSLATGTVRSGWPVDTSTISHLGVTFDPTVQNQRGALAFVGGTVYVPYAGHAGDCGDYRGWLIGVALAHPDRPMAWSTSVRGGGSWGPSGVASDGNSVFIATGNTFGAQMWSGGEAVIRFSPGPLFSGESADYFAPPNWQQLDAQDLDLGGSGTVLIDLPGNTPGTVAVALAKTGQIFVLDPTNLGGVSAGLANAVVANSEIINASTAFTSSTGTHVVFRGTGAQCPSGQGNGLAALTLTAGTPPTIATAWCGYLNGQGSPISTTTDGDTQPIVWVVGAEGDGVLRGYDGDNGTQLYASDPLPFTRRFVAPIVANGRLFVGTDNAVVAFTTK